MSHLAALVGASCNFNWSHWFFSSFLILRFFSAYFGACQVVYSFMRPFLLFPPVARRAVANAALCVLFAYVSACVLFCMPLGHALHMHVLCFVVVVKYLQSLQLHVVFLDVVVLLVVRRQKWTALLSLHSLQPFACFVCCGAWLRSFSQGFDVPGTFSLFRTLQALQFSHS